MKSYIYLQVYLVIKLVSANIKIDAIIEAETEGSDCLIAEEANEVNEVNDPEYVISNVAQVSPTRQPHAKGSDTLAIPYREDNVQSSQEVESSEKSPLELPVPIPVPYMEEFTRPPDENATTINSATWKYQSNTTSEESEESKSTLIDYPFSVSIQRKGSHYATGALVNKRWIISAAGEFFNVRESLKLYRARLGSVDCKRGGELVPLKKIEIHPYYVYKKPNFDIALIRMAKNVAFTSFIRPIAISNIKGTVISAKFMTSYWPRVLIQGATLPLTALERVLHNSMRVSTQRLIPSRKCTETIKSINELLNESSLCLKPIVAHHSICMPDAGAPVVADDGLWGVTSGWISPLCPEYPAPTIFTRLSSESVRSWLDIHLLAAN